MGKSKKLKRLGGKVSHPGPLEEQLLQDEVAQPSGRIKVRSERKDEDDEVNFIRFCCEEIKKVTFYSTS